MKRLSHLIVSILVIVVLFGCKDTESNNYITLTNTNNDDELPCYKIDISNASKVEVIIINEEVEDSKTTLTEVTYNENIEDVGELKFLEEDDLQKSYGGIVGVYDTKLIDNHSNLEDQESSFIIANYNILNLNNKIEITENDRIQLFTIQSGNNKYNIYLDITFHK